jgi:sugar lactone lactonase YvrE
VAVDAAGNLFIADVANNRVRKVDPTGIITTVAGTGPADCGPYAGCTGTFGGDGGPATDAQLSGPWGVAVDAAGNLFIADTGNQRLREVDIAGTIATVGGNGLVGRSGDGGPATSAELNGPAGVALDPAGNLFIADANQNCIRKVDPTGTITTVAGNGIVHCDAVNGCNAFSGDDGPATNAQLNWPNGVAVDRAGNLLIADAGHNRIRKVDTAGTITTVAGTGSVSCGSSYCGGFSGDGGPATSARLSNPAGVAADAAGNLFIADTSNQRLREVDTAGIIATVAGNGTTSFGGDTGPGTSAQLKGPSGVALDLAGNLFIPDAGNNRIRMVDSAGTITTVAGGGSDGLGDGGPATNAQLNLAYSLSAEYHLAYAGVAVDAAGNLLIADVGNQRIRKVDTAGTITTVAGNGTYGFGGDEGPATSAQLNLPSGVAVDLAGNLFIADSWNQRIRKVDTTGTITTVAGGGNDGLGDGGPATSAQLSLPSGLAVDAAGNLFIADLGNNRIRKVDAAGTINTVAGTGDGGFAGDGGPATNAQLKSPSDVVVDAAGTLFIVDSYNQRLRKVDPAGTITTVAGIGTSNCYGMGGGCYGAFSGDGGPAISAELNDPSGVVVDPAGNLLIADWGNNRIRKVEASTPTCDGDCNGNGQVTIDELLTLVNIALGNAQPSACPHGVPRGAEVNVALIIQAVNHALNGCGGA